MAEEIKCTALDVVIGGFPGPWYRVVLSPAGYLKYLCDDEGGAHSEIIVRPPQKAWTRFYEDCKALGVSGWEREYSNPDIADGSSWTCRLEIGDLSYDGSGLNAFPPDGDIEPGRMFDGFCYAISCLVGGLEFI